MLLDIKNMKNKVALIFGVTGQDGSYLSKFLLKKGYKVHGVKEDLHRLTHLELTPFIKILMTKKEIFIYILEMSQMQSLSLV